jgi:hypothetical protein
MNHPSLRRAVLVVIPVLLALLFSVLLLATSSPGPSSSSAPPPPLPANPAMITWTPTSTEAIVSPGETQTVSVTFVSSKNIRRASVQVSPRLATFVQTEPMSFERIRKGQQQTLNLIIAPSATATLGTIAGSIQLQRGKVNAGDTEADDEDRRDAGKLLPQPLAVTVNVWTPIKDPTTGLQVRVPPFGDNTRLVVNTSTPGQSFIDFQLQEGQGGPFVSEFGMFLYSNPSHLGLSQWFEQNIDVDGILAANRTFQDRQLLDGSDALVFSGPMPAQYLDVGTPLECAYRLSPSGNQIISITQSQVNSLFSRGYSQEAISNLEIQILGTVHF